MGMAERLYRKLIAWQEAHALCVLIYEITKKFPNEEKYALVNQMRRSSYGIPMNIAEGNGRRSANEKARFFEIALSSLDELDYQLILSKDLEYISEQTMETLVQHIHRVSYLLTKLRASFINSQSL